MTVPLSVFFYVTAIGILAGKSTYIRASIRTSFGPSSGFMVLKAVPHSAIRQIPFFRICFGGDAQG
jgi:hypothetical protein